MRIMIAVIYKKIFEVLGLSNSIETKINELSESIGDKEDIQDSPFFAMFTQYSNSNASAFYYDKNFNLFRSFRTEAAISSMTELGSNNYSRTQTNGITSTGSGRGNGTSAVSILGHCSVELCKSDGSIGFRDGVSLGPVSTGTWVNGKTDKKSLHLIDGKIFVTNRSTKMVDIDSTQPMSSTPFNIYAKGSIGYNESTKVLAIAETNSSYQTRIHVFRNIEAPDTYASTSDLYAAMQTTETSSYFTNPPYSSGAREHRERAVVTVCDDNTIFVTKMIPSHGMYCIRFNEDQVTLTHEPLSTSVYHQTYSTTYGIDQGNDNGIRHNITKDQKIVLAYSPAYYYGSGFFLVAIDVTLSRFVHYQYKGSSYGHQIIPYGKNGVLVNKSINSDGGLGSSVYILDVKNDLDTATGGELISLPTVKTKIFDCGYNSTNYPYMIPMSCDDISSYI